VARRPAALSFCNGNNHRRGKAKAPGSGLIQRHSIFCVFTQQYGLAFKRCPLSGIAQTALAPKALDAKTKELIALGIGIAIRCDDCIAFHIKAAVERGATREEISETLGMAIYMGAGPSVMYASHAFAALQQFEAEKTVGST
jgi:AhpD family alkylhydroperoxidase